MMRRGHRDQWGTVTGALRSFAADQSVREQLQAHGFRVDFDPEGTQLATHVVTEPRVGLTPLKHPVLTADSSPNQLASESSDM